MQIGAGRATGTAGATSKQSAGISPCWSSRAAGQHRGHQLTSSSSGLTSHRSSLHSRGQLQLVRSQFDVDDSTVEQLPNVGELGPR
jgi:hypothetical protein